MNETSLAGKRIVITGSSRGLGRAFAVACVEAGAQIVINGTSADALDETAELIRAAGAEPVIVRGSVADEDLCRQLVGQCVDSYGGIDVMVHNAGIVRDRTLLKMTAEEFDAVIAVHLRGAWACTKHAGLAMRENGGHIIQIISASGLSGGFGQGNYAAAKAGMMGLLRTAVLELTRFGIRCNAMWPVAETDMTQVVFQRAEAQAQAEGKTAPSPREMGFGKPHEVAAGLVWLASDAAAELNGQCLSFNGRKTALWSHPAEVGVTFHDEAWTVDELASHYEGVTPQPIYRPPMIKP